MASDRFEAVRERSRLVRGAASTMEKLHAGVWRETGAGEVQFFHHPLAVARLLTDHGADEETIAAGLLHDALEYSNVRPDRIGKAFGDRVRRMVEAVTENPAIERYEKRKREVRQRVGEADHDTRLVFAAEKVANVISMRHAYEIEGEDIAEGLPVPLTRKIVLWEYDMEMLFDCREGVPLFDRLSEELLGLWRQRMANEEAESL